ncbi:TRAP transporter small permease subunit [Pseudooceanicola sp. CBS1P-1]|uniref:TRAP transporter small permease protein n=1 Tax=Pseudooceanicola albus TaxID=2692189 RepID=A0A6L7G7J0_9RHOB|nr:MULTISPECIES: TRAP transporter small permease subunit [Pseudooceanicola]MBT9386209.1 TRAP transporter small permease subunit [Pseudooceanicola endophyticus]MXN19376.1 TRAP transporter small permease subunit [Pseudooceanicola albus]
MKQLHPLLRRAAALPAHLSALLFGSMFAVFILQIVFRYALDLPVGWTVEWVTLAWLWGILLAAAFVIPTDNMIKLDIIYALLPRGARRVLDVVAGLVTAAIFAWTLPKAWDYVTFMDIERTAYMRLPFSWVFAIYMPFHIAVIIRMLLVAWNGLTGGAPVPETHAETHDYD